MAPGVVPALLSALLFGLAAPLAQPLIRASDPILVAGLMYLGAGLGLALLAPVTPRGGAPITRRDLPCLGAVIVMGGILAPVLLMSGLDRTDAATAALLLNLESVATLAIAWLWFRESVDRRLLLGAAAILAGAALLSWQGTGALSFGALLVAGACLAWGIDNNLTRALAHLDPGRLAMVKGLVAGAVNLTVALARGADLPSWGLTAAAMALGLAGIGVSLVLFIRALAQLGAARAGAYYATAPFAGALMAVLLLSAPVTPALLVAGVLMALGVGLHLTEQHAHDHDHAPTDHDHAHRHDDGHHTHTHPAGTPARHSHPHRHGALTHRHAHTPDLHHRHGH